MAQVMESRAAEPSAMLSIGELQHRARRRRYEVWTAQVSAHQEPCFGTALRFLCDERACSWRSECLRLRAEWLG
jgi:hypothetical protein